MRYFIFLLLYTSIGLAEETTSPQLQKSKLLASEESKESLSITKYNPIYFLYGEPTTKVQFSFKYQVIESLPVYLGYTQLMLWYLSKKSAPFKDVNYNPEIFYSYKINKGVFDSVDISPISHFSNGRDGEDSRSINRAFARFNFMSPLSEGAVKLSATLFSYYTLSKDNSDIYDYISPLDLKFAVTEFVPWIFDRGEFYFHIFPGGSYAERWDRGGQEVGLSFRLGGIGLKPSLYFEYYNGYAESLLDYSHPSSTFRAGIIL